MQNNSTLLNNIDVEALKEENIFLYNVFDAIADGISVLDRDFNILMANRWLKEHNINDVLIGKKCYKTYQNLDTICPWCPVIHSFASGEVEQEIVSIPTLNGEQEWIELTIFPIKDKNGEISKVIEYVKNITDLKRAHDELILIKKRHDALLQNMLDGFGMIDMNGKIVEVNDAYCKLSGYTKEELIGVSIENIEVVDTQIDIHKRMVDIKKEKGAIFESIHRKKSGELWSVEASVGFIDIEDGQIFGLFRDITHRHIKSEIKELKRELSKLVVDRDISQELLLQTAVNKAEELTNSKIAFFHFVEPDQENISLQVWSSNTLEKMCFAKGHSTHYPISQAGVWVDCIYQRKSVVYNDYESLPHKKGLPQGHVPLKRFISVPLIHNGKFVAIMGVGNKEYDYNEKDVKVVEEILSEAYQYYERYRVENRVEYMTYYDSLTNLPNRVLFSRKLEELIALSEDDERLIGVCYLDLDGFKPVNDQYGHTMGDKLLKELAKRLKESIDEEDMIARLGGDEFAFILQSFENQFGLTKKLEEILVVINRAFDLDGQRVHISGSIGATIYPIDKSDADTLLRHADQAMYKAKESGKSTYRIYEYVENSYQRLNTQLIDEFKKAISSDELVLHYQPKIDLENGDVIGFEALIRWNHPTKGLLYPDKFLAIIEKTPLEIELGEWVIKQALKELELLHSQGKHLTISINISPRHIKIVDFIDFLSNAIKQYDPEIISYLEIEILEVASIENEVTVIGTMQRCANMGIKFSLDDFGTGYSSLTHFHKLPIDILKIDQNFVKNMLDDINNFDIVNGILKLTQTLQRPVIAEGVESIEIGLALLSLGCQYAQGYGIAKAMPKEKIDSWLKRWEKDSIWRSLNYKKAQKVEYFDVDVAVFSHLIWIDSISEYIEKRENKEPITNSESCQFNRWYQGIGQDRYASHEIYPFLQSLHYKMHQKAIEVKELSDKHQDKKARVKMSELKSSANRFIEMLKLLKK